jgi:hypothetical protein
LTWTSQPNQVTPNSAGRLCGYLFTLLNVGKVLRGVDQDLAETLNLLAAAEHDNRRQPQPTRSGALQHLQLVPSRKDFELQRSA